MAMNNFRPVYPAHVRDDIIDTLRGLFAEYDIAKFDLDLVEKRIAVMVRALADLEGVSFIRIEAARQMVEQEEK